VQLVDIKKIHNSSHAIFVSMVHINHPSVHLIVLLVLLVRFKILLYAVQLCLTALLMKTKPGTYSLEDGASQCSSCEGMDGLTCESSGHALIETDYWSWTESYSTVLPSGIRVTNQKLLTRPCVRGRCLGGEYIPALPANGSEVSMGYKCGANRLQTSDNIMCGHCATGYTEIGTTCTGTLTELSHLFDTATYCYIIECGEPVPEMIVLVIILIFVLVFVLHVFAQTASGLPSIFFYFGKAAHSVSQSL
jgi:hypothetical protein